MKKILGMLCILLASSAAQASSSRVGLFDTIGNNVGGPQMVVPGAGATILSDSNTVTLSNKTISGLTNTISNISGSSLAAGAAVTNLGYTPLNKAGDTMSGNLNMGGNSVTNLNSTPVANGAAVLDGSAKIPVTELPSTVMEYQGAWNASTNTPTLANTGCVTGTNGNTYRVSVAGTQDLGAGSITFQVGDFIICTSSLGQWQDSPAADGVTSVNGLQGAVVLNHSNISGVAGNGANSDITSLTGLTTPLPVSEGGSGVATHTVNGMIFGNGTSAVGTTAAGTQYQVFQAGASGVPTVDAVHLDQSAAITGTLPVGNGGTGATTLTSHGVLIGNGTSAVTTVSPGSSGNVLQSNGTSWVSVAPSVTSPAINGGSGAPESVTAVGGVTLTSIGYSNYVWVVGHSGAVTVTATPSITACTQDGQSLVVVGTDNTNTVTLQDQSNLSSSGLSLNGDFVAAKDSSLIMHCDITQGLWIEDARR